MRQKITLVILIFIGILLLFTSCKKTVTIPTVSTDNVSNILKNSADCGGNVTNDGEEFLKMRGICWSINQNPTIKDSITDEATHKGPFYSRLTKLIPDTRYYVRAYASNSAGIGYGEEKTFITPAY
jgi:collagen type VII alpha